ncbi:MAG: phosphohydrolase [Bacteroidetes bacterium GWF2_38_335]|nr:MAG: phosphohydrolase [Bacteroidetes bacterium GWF2_38_335]OFY81626.1 MAG: phosphohydrolase [Bacteroidetes bacterium RIFOXYA12_FULL_38_20]HBS88978.1 phosphohydrolase [Bacteroidales bacterium]
MEKAIEKIREQVRQQFMGEVTGHDWWHIKRVTDLSIYLGKKENANLQIVEIAALLHDIADWKFHDGNENKGPEMAAEIMKSHAILNEISEQVTDIIKTISFKGAGVATPMKTIEGKVVQDADRLDAMGAIGIARAFAYGGSRNREIYNPDIKPEMHSSFGEYKKSKGHTINHFYEKLLLLKDRMNTETAKEMAESRHGFMVEYLERFFGEWNLKSE